MYWYHRKSYILKINICIIIQLFIIMCINSYDIKIYFCFSVLKTLIKLKKESPDYISIKALSKIKETIIRLGKIGFSFLFSLRIIFYRNPMLKCCTVLILNETIYCKTMLLAYHTLLENLSSIALLLLHPFQYHIFKLIEMKHMKSIIYLT